MDSNDGKAVEKQIGGTSFQLPSRIGFGVLSYKSIKRASPVGENWKPVLTAGYVAKEGDPVYEIWVEGKCCHVEEFLDGKRIAVTEGKTIEEVFLKKFQEIGENPRFLRIREKVSKGRNISFIHPDKNLARSVTFPLGIVFLLRLPVFERGKIFEMREELTVLGSRFIHEVICGGEILTASCKEVRHFFSDFVEFYVKLFEFEEAVNQIFDLGLVEPGKPSEYGLHVLDPVTAKRGAFTVCGRKEGPISLAYAHWLKRPGDINAIKAEDCLMEALKRERNKLNEQGIRSWPTENTSN